ncbi:MAG: DUF4157 domain-containing protein [Myxococcota bacterium]
MVITSKFVRSTTPRPLNDEERSWALRALDANHTATEHIRRRAVERCLLIPTNPSVRHVRGLRSAIANLSLANRASGITMGRKVFIREELFGPNAEVDLRLVVHEVTHVVQFMRDGFVTFITRYLNDYAEGRARGLSDYDAYLAIGYEQEARAVEDFVRRHAYTGPRSL